MPKNLFQFSCPCCGKDIEVNVRSGKARAINPDEKRGKDFEELVDEQAHASDHFGSMFEAAKQDQASQDERLDQLFSDAAEKAKKDKDKDQRPSNPFDLD